MPWCAGCDRFLSPSTVTVTGDCPRCGATVDPGRARPPEAPAAGGPGPAGGAATASTGAPDVGPSPVTPVADGPGTLAAPGDDAPAASDEEVPLPIPWHFKLLVGAIALYLGWRAFQGVEWLARQL